MPITIIGDTKFFYEIHGIGHPLMLIAGLGSDSQSWLPILEDLSRHYMVITMDHRGISRSSPLNTEISMEKLADDCLSILRHLGISSAHILGHSMGGFIAMDMAIRHPECVDRLILAGTSTFSSRRNTALLSDWASYLEQEMDPELWFRNIFYWIFRPAFFENEETVKDFINFELNYPYPIDKFTFRKQAEAISRFDCAGTVSNIAAGTLVIAGQEDLLFSPDDCIKLAQTIPRAQYRVIRQAGHSIFTENPKDFTECVLEFLDSP
jgi:pimeloyl-ACP methyl ester carboxylesterase